MHELKLRHCNTLVAKSYMLDISAGIVSIVEQREL